MPTKRNEKKIEFGDFQTPLSLAEQVCSTVKRLGLNPRTVVEPTCGQGSFLIAAAHGFDSVTHLIGTDVNPVYVKEARRKLDNFCLSESGKDSRIMEADFFLTDWNELLSELPDPLLILGNPPWVTNSELASMNSGNLPDKRNFLGLSGIEAITGASNFDISEWMLLKMLEWVDNRLGAIAMLCKAAVARKVLLYSWKNDFSMTDSRIYEIDAHKAFGASVDACLLVYDNITGGGDRSCFVYRNLSSNSPYAHIGFRDDVLVADVDLFEKWHHLALPKGSAPTYVWRSGIKHDSSKIMELQRTEAGFFNKLGEVWVLEEEYVYPMYKSSDISGKVAPSPRRWMLVTQRSVGEETLSIKMRAPLTWEYLKAHANALDNRRSSIYRNRPRFSVFGVGEYSFSPWKVAISGMYKELSFEVVGSHQGKPIVLDDTCYFIACQTREEAEFLAFLLNSSAAKEFYSAFIFWNDKRPITAKLLRRLDLVALVKELGVQSELKTLVDAYSVPSSHYQLKLLESRLRYGVTKAGL
jgi:hypothetical protein